MKRFNIFLCAALTVAFAASCDDTNLDLPATPEWNLVGQYSTYMRTQGWIEEDQIGVFVIPEEAESESQVNLLYVPSKVCPVIESPYVQGVLMYDDENAANMDVMLTAKGAAAEFNAGSSYYAYVPYSETAADYENIKLPKLDKQEWIPMTQEGRAMQYFKPEYNFAYADMAFVFDGATAIAARGEFKSPFVQMTIPSPTFPDEAEDKVVSKLVVSADSDIATADATINLKNGRVSGTMSKSVELTLGDATTFTLGKNYFGDVALGETLNVILCLDYEEGLNTEFTFTFTVDGQEVVAKGTPSATGASDGNLNMYDSISFVE